MLRSYWQPAALSEELPPVGQPTRSWKLMTPDSF